MNSKSYFKKSFSIISMVFIKNIVIILPLVWITYSLKKPELVTMKGSVTCKNQTHILTKVCDLKFISNQGIKFDIETNTALMAKHCEKHRDLKVSLVATKYPKFLLWGPNLTVNGFHVLKTI